MTRLDVPFGLGYALPQVFPDGPIDPALVGRVARAAEEAGFESLWTQQQPIGTAQCLDALTLLGYVAALTERAHLGVSVLLLPLLDPLQLAKATASLDALSGGRLRLGIGLGAPRYYPPSGADAGTRVARLLEALAVLKALWTDDVVSHSGRFFRYDGVSVRPHPVRRPHPPVWFGGRVRAALRRAAVHGDGWMGAGSSSGADFVTHAAVLREELARAGRDPSTFPVSKRVYLAVDDDAARARARLRAWFAHDYGDADLADRVAVWGRRDAVVERLAELVAAGANHLLLNPVVDIAEHVEILRDLVPPSTVDSGGASG
ncbi:TIGR03619 family F420-dependent LLM class oxidoreductase [Phytohabitans sp. ZYX-F-186]|uniref:TIGR03619 family F420-dependent LLM class oxidoreductase n=1 Tax=Phytohabitans maris TaxID=3071409 RepID=A0ABU0ZN59_9ACTN|nr:TIGR03619 family F420-dependent LLM class oxidoreductase [Phytohabitans sp. ZYX-F-186]MDQ7908473.1 TIGR03619 family F420-dependent LLM class oxidoreductase [Phytohabitans sp. ZYX-F-186]